MKSLRRRNNLSRGSVPAAVVLLALLLAALSPDARRGFEIFTGKGKCSGCHFGPHLSDAGSTTEGTFPDDPSRVDIAPPQVNPDPAVHA